MTTDHVDFSLLEVPLAGDIDPDEYLRTAMHWHFGEDTGSPYWLERARTLGFDPRADVETFDDLTLFPNIVDELRAVPVEDLVPRGYGPGGPRPLTFESGGTTGLPKRVIFPPGWLEYLHDRNQRYCEAHGLPTHRNRLAVLPSGPHFAGALVKTAAELDNTTTFTIDLDPRWVKKLMAQGQTEQVQQYVQHVVDQAVQILRTQHVGILVITPPLLRALASRPDAVELVTAKIAIIWWGGAHMTVDDRYLYNTVVFPGIPLVGMYSSTMILGDTALQRPAAGPDEEAVFDTDSPITTFRVIDPATGQPTPFGARGQVVMNHVSKAMFLPNNLERDTAIRVPAPAGQVGDSVAGPKPVEFFGTERVIEGVY
ncbi:phenazine antibiotic biosynthesis protein [Nocardia sp. CDC159]|nr:phenazine antibiotic biosynthesis protein [Nocardia pulmonis]MCM6784751.1 phenazine antibiotic biosynthesis protein [Nocardia sp. CDC159]